MPPGAASIVNDLIRAAASIPKDISDAELDKHVADLLVKEAKAKESRWRELGIGVCLESVRDETSGTSALPKPNKRFLSSVIRQVDDHNTALLREQALAAQEASRDLPIASSSRDPHDSRPQERGSRPNRPVGAARLFGGALGAARTSKNRQTEVEDRRDHRRERSPSRSYEASSSRSYVDRERGDDRSPGSSHRYEDSRRSEQEYRRDKSSTTAPRYRSRSRDVRTNLDQENKRQSTRRERSRSLSRIEDKSSAIRKRRSESKSRGDRSSLQMTESEADNADAPPIQSKMDRYFEESYNPQLDLTGVLNIPSSGLVPDVGWDNMLAVLKEKGKKRRATSPGLSQSPPPESSRRRQRSASPTRRRSERHGQSNSKKEEKKKHRSRHRSPRSEGSYYDSEDSETRARRKRKKRKQEEKKRAQEEEEDKRKYGGYVYARPGSTREWDVGKVDMSF